MTVEAAYEDEVGHWTQRIRHLTRVMEDVGADRELAMYRASQRGVEVGEIAHLALLEAAEVERMLAMCRRDPDIDSFSEGPDWVRFYRK